jgi:hypothetical protein
MCKQQAKITRINDIQGVNNTGKFLITLAIGCVLFRYQYKNINLDIANGIENKT